MTSKEIQTASGLPGAVSVRVEGLLKRPDFLNTAKGRVAHSKGFVLQARKRNDEAAPIRVGFTCSKKVGNAVARNRAKRRLREIARLELPQHGRPGWDYVLIGRRGATATLEFERLRDDLRKALKEVHS